MRPHVHTRRLRPAGGSLGRAGPHASALSAADEYTAAAGDDGIEEEDQDEAGSASGSDESEAFSELSDPGGTEVVYVKEGVAVWPSRSERIMGRLSLVSQHTVLFLAWLPYSRGTLQEDGTFKVTAVPAGAGGSGSSPAKAHERAGAPCFRTTGRMLCAAGWPQVAALLCWS